MKHLFGCSIKNSKSNLKKFNNKSKVLSSNLISSTFLDFNYLLKVFYSNNLPLFYRSVGYGSFLKLSVFLSKNYNFLGFLSVPFSFNSYQRLPLGFFKFLEFFFNKDFLFKLSNNLLSHFFFFFKSVFSTVTSVFTNFSLINCNKVGLGYSNLLLFKVLFSFRYFFKLVSGFSMVTSIKHIPNFSKFSGSVFNYINSYNFDVHSFSNKISNSTNLLGLSFLSTVNTKLANWRDKCYDIFNSNFLSLVFKTSRNNIFLTIVDSGDSVIWKTSGGSVGLHGKEKSSVESIRRLVHKLTSFLRQKGISHNFVFRFFYVQGLEYLKAQQLLSSLNRNFVYFSFISYDVRHPHGYMRLRKPRRL